MRKDLDDVTSTSGEFWIFLFILIVFICILDNLTKKKTVPLEEKTGNPYEHHCYAFTQNESET